MGPGSGFGLDRSNSIMGTELRKACHVSLSVHMEQLGSHYTDFDETWYLSFFRKSVEKIQVSLEPDMNNWYFMWRRFDIFDYISLNSF
jgi:hypothetical protein